MESLQQNTIMFSSYSTMITHPQVRERCWSLMLSSHLQSWKKKRDGRREEGRKGGRNEKGKKKNQRKLSGWKFLERRNWSKTRTHCIFFIFLLYHVRIQGQLQDRNHTVIFLIEVYLIYIIYIIVYDHRYIIDLQYCVSFRYTAKVIQIYFPDSFPL